MSTSLNFETILNLDIDSKNVNVVSFLLQLAGGILTGKHRYEDKDSGKIQHGRYAGTGPWADV